MKGIRQDSSNSERFIRTLRTRRFSKENLRTEVHQNREDERNPSGFFEFRKVHQNLEDEKIFDRKSSNGGLLRALGTRKYSKENLRTRPARLMPPGRLKSTPVP
jgi:hypothetical protein